MRLPSPKKQLARIRDFRRAQRDLLRESNRPSHLQPETPQTPVEEQPEDPVETLSEELAQGPAPAQTPTPTPTHAPPEESSTSRFGVAGLPLNRHSPFYIGFFGALGAMVAVGLWHAFGRLATTLTILLVSLFLTLALNPLVEALLRRRVPRALAVLTVFAGLLVVFGLLGWLVIPPVIQQTTDLVNKAPTYLQNLLDTPWVQQFDRDFEVVDRFQKEFNARITDQNFIQSVLGGILGAGRFVASGVFQTITVLILTLYFMSSLPRMKQAAYALVPSTRRVRVVSLSEEIMRRTGSYAIGQVSIATLNAICSYVMMSILEIPMPRCWLSRSASSG